MQDGAGNKKRNFFLRLSFLILLLFPSNGLADDHQTNLLRQKMQENLLMRERMKGKKELATGLTKTLVKEILELKTEILLEKKRKKIRGYRKVPSPSRISYNLKLIQQLQAYTSELSEKIVYFQSCNDRLEFFYQQGNDDLMIVRTLNGMKVEKLIEQIDQTLRESRIAVENKLIDINKIILKKPEIIWNEILGK